MDIFISNLISRAQEDRVQKLSVGAAIIHEEKILILQRTTTDFMPNIYELPGGALEGNESLLGALERELMEETGCSIERIVGYIDHIDFASSTGRLTRRFNFLVEPKLPILVRLSEHQGHAWINPLDACSYDITPQTRKIISLVQDGIIQEL